MSLASFFSFWSHSSLARHWTIEGDCGREKDGDLSFYGKTQQAPQNGSPLKVLEDACIFFRWNCLASSCLATTCKWTQLRICDACTQEKKMACPYFFAPLKPPERVEKNAIVKDYLCSAVRLLKMAGVVLQALKASISQKSTQLTILTQ